MVKVKDLRDLMGVSQPHEFLHCSKCYGQYSANAADYWNLPADYTFKCCRRNMMLVRRVSTLVEVSCNV